MEKLIGFIMMLWMDILYLIFHLGTVFIKDVSKVTNLFLDVHLMISEPQKYVDEFIKKWSKFNCFSY